MKIVMTTVGRKGPGGEGENGDRLRSAEAAIVKAANIRAAAIAFPGGFFSTNDEGTRKTLSEKLIGIARKSNIAVIFGIDQQTKIVSEDWIILKKGLMLPYYGYGWSPNEDIVHCWAQRSSDSNNQWWASDERCNDVRVIRVGNDAVGILMCGEIFNERIRNSSAKYLPKPKLIVDVAHIGQRFRVWQGMKKLADLGLSSVCTVHAQREYARKYCYIPGKGNMSTSTPDDSVSWPIRIELKSWVF
jgi:hypothetical protein